MNLVAYIFALILTQQTPKEEFRIIPAPIKAVLEVPQYETTVITPAAPVVVPPPVIDNEPQGQVMTPNGCHVAEQLPPEKCQ